MNQDMATEATLLVEEGVIMGEEIDRWDRMNVSNVVDLVTGPVIVPQLVVGEVFVHSRPHHHALGMVEVVDEGIVMYLTVTDLSMIDTIEVVMGIGIVMIVEMIGMEAEIAMPMTGTPHLRIVSL